MISDRVRSNLAAEFSRSLLPKLGAVILIGLILMATFAPILATHDPTRTGYTAEDGQPYPPIGTSYETEIAQDGEFGEITVESTPEHVLGTNTVGQDVYSRALYGARVSLIVGVVGVLLALAIGVPFGLVAGYYGGRVDNGLMRIADVMLAFPALVLALALIGIFGKSPILIPDPLVVAFSAQESITVPLVGTTVPLPGFLVGINFLEGMPTAIPIPGTVTIVAALVTWVWFARVARGEALSLRSEEYVKAARSFGASNRTILIKHVLPNSLTPVIVLATIQVAVIILLEASLAYLGFSGTTLSWGYEIERGQDVLRQRPWVAVVPGIGIMLAVIAVNLLGDWLRDALDPNIDGSQRGV
ncbi:MAG: ABC transporter permease [Halobacteriota archaeon]